MNDGVFVGRIVEWLYLLEIYFEGIVAIHDFLFHTIEWGHVLIVILTRRTLMVDRHYEFTLAILDLPWY